VKASIRNKPTDILLTTVSLTIDKANPDNLIMFRCYHCGTSITQIQGAVTGVFSGLMPTNEVVVINQCSKCHANITFQTLPTPKNPEVTKLKLSYEKGIETFHCFICRTQLLQYNADILISLPERKHLIMPLAFTCFKPDCHKQYLLNEIVTVVL